MRTAMINNSSKLLSVVDKKVLIDAHIAFYFPRQNLNANHRANDWVILEGVDQCLSARFMYGPLDMVSLSNEKVRDLSFSPYVNGS